MENKTIKVRSNLEPEEHHLFFILAYNTKSKMTITLACGYLKDSQVMWVDVSLFILVNVNPRFTDAVLSCAFVSY